MAGTTGYRDTNTIESTILKRDIRSAILQYDQDITPLLVLSSKLNGGSVPTVNPKFEWYEEDRETRRDTSTTASTGPTTLAVSDGTRWNAEEVWVNVRTGEGFRVSSVSVNNVTVVPNLAGAGSVATVSGDEYLKVGVSKMEGDVSVTAHSGNPTAKFNYTQIFERTASATRTAQNTANYTSPVDWEFRRQRMIKEFKIDKEAAYLWGPGAARDTTGTHPRTLTRGVRASITTNVKDFGGTLTESEFFDAFDAAFRYSNASKVKFGLAGRTPVSVIGAFPRGKLEVIQSDNDDTFGLSIMKFKHAHGTLNLMTHNLFSDSPGQGTVAGYSTEVIILDMSSDGENLVREHYLQNSDVTITENVQENDRDGRKDKILCESGIETGLEKHHALWKGASA
jgi:hypothetical protein